MTLRAVPLACVHAAWALVLSFCALTAQAATPRKPSATEPEAVIARVDAAPQIDGRLDDALWETATVLDSFLQVRPERGAAPSRRTDLRWASDGVTLFIAVRAFEPQPQRIVARSRSRDALGSDDQVAIVIDAQGSARNGFWFAVNANGAQADGRITDGKQLRAEWDGAWQAAAVVDDEGWSAEFALPLALLEPPAATTAPPVWRINAERSIAATNEAVRLRGATLARELTVLGDALRVAGIAAQEDASAALRVRAGLRLSAERDRSTEPATRRTRLQPSVDVFWRARPGLATALTLNNDPTDGSFSRRNVNLGRFEQFQQETRTFFTEDAGRFAFGGLDGDEPTLLPLFTRRIGIDADGNARALDIAARAGGTLGPVEFGLLAAQVARDDEGSRARAFALRASAEVTPQWRVGLIGTNGSTNDSADGSPDGKGSSSLLGVDAQYRSTDWWTDKTVQANLWRLRSSQRNEAGAREQGAASGGELSFPNQGWNGAVSWQRIDTAFAPALGFVEETGVHKSAATLGWQQQLAGGGSIETFVEHARRKQLAGEEFTRDSGAGVLASNAAGDFIGFNAGRTAERIASAFEPAPGVVVQPGAYRSRYLGASLGASDTRALSGEFYANRGGYYGGRSREIGAELAWQPLEAWRVEASHGVTRLTQQSARFTVRESSLAVDYTPCTRTSAALFMQWDNVSRQLGFGARVQWQLEGGPQLVAAYERLAEERRPSQGVRSAATLRAVWVFTR